LIDPLPASAGYLWGPMRDALKNNDWVVRGDSLQSFPDG
jgi:hypothetical protein